MFRTLQAQIATLSCLVDALPRSRSRGAAAPESRSGRLAAMALLAFGGVASAQEMLPDRVVREVLDVREVVVDAVVTNRDDAPVPDLRADDFALRVDGRKAKVTSVLTGRDLRESVAGRVTVVVLLDERHLLATHRDAILARVAEALAAEMEANPTWVAVAALGRELEPLLPPTREVAEMRRVLQAAAFRPATDNALRDQQRRASREVRETLSGIRRSGTAYKFAEAQAMSVLNGAIDYGSALARDTRSTLDGVGSLVDAMSFVPGRKVVLLISDGLPRQPLDVLSKAVLDRFGGAAQYAGGDDVTAQSSDNYVSDSRQRPTGHGRADFHGMRLEQQGDGGALAFQQVVAGFDCSDLYERIVALANTHRVTFYPVKPPVVDTSVSGLGEREGERGSIAMLSDMRAGLDALAVGTGGLAFDSESGVEDFLRQANEDAAAYYALSFRPPESGDRAVREVVLRVRRKKTKLRFRSSYLPVDLEETLSSQAWGTLLFGWQDNLHALEVDTRAGDLVEETHAVDVMLSLPIGKMELAPIDGVARGAYRVVMQLMNASGERMKPAHVGFEVQLPEADVEQAADQYYAVRTGLALAPGTYQMAVGLWEENTGRSTFLVQEVVVGVAAESEA